MTRGANGCPSTAARATRRRRACECRGPVMRDGRDAKERQAMNATGRRLDFLDSFRGFAVLWVFLVHVVLAAYGAVALPWAGSFADFARPPGGWTFYLVFPASLGWAGVPVFFVVSGVCIHLSHRRSPDQSWVSFFRRRWWRIVPPYLAALLAFAFLWPDTQLTRLTTLAPWLQ